MHFEQISCVLGAKLQEVLVGRHREAVDTRERRHDRSRLAPTVGTRPDSRSEHRQVALRRVLGVDHGVEIAPSDAHVLGAAVVALRPAVKGVVLDGSGNPYPIQLLTLVTRLTVRAIKHK